MAQPLLNTGHQRAAKSAAIRIVGGIFLDYASWNVSLSGDDLDTVNFESFSNDGTGNSYSEGILGILRADFDFGGDWDAGRNAYGNPPGLYPRDDFADLNLFISSPTSPFGQQGWFFQWSRIRTSKNGGVVQGKVTFSATGINQGGFRYPLGDT